MTDALTIRQMMKEDLEIAIGWAREEGWNPGLDDADAFLAADPDGFLMAFVGDEPVASISVVAYDDAFGFLGLYICKPEYRGRGYGWAVWQAGIERLGDRTIGLDGVVAQQANYARSGFELAHRNIRYGGISMVDTPAEPRLAPIGRGLYPSVRDYDRSFFPAPRDAFLQSWLTPDAATRKGFAFVEDGTVTGYGTIRSCDQGFKIGPLFAETEEVADILFRALAGLSKGQEIYLDPPEPNATALALAERYELSPVFETARMYRGTAPTLPLGKTYGSTTFELG